MTSQDVQSFVEYIAKNEGIVEHPYLDINGLITTGVGSSIDKKDEFMAVDFVVQLDVEEFRLATWARVQRGFGALYPSGVFRAKDGGMVLDGDVDTHLDDLPAVLGEGSFVLTRAAVATSRAVFL